MKTFSMSLALNVSTVSRPVALSGIADKRNMSAVKTYWLSPGQRNSVIHIVECCTLFVISLALIAIQEILHRRDNSFEPNLM